MSCFSIFNHLQLAFSCMIFYVVSLVDVLARDFVDVYLAHHAYNAKYGIGIGHCLFFCQTAISSVH